MHDCLIVLLQTFCQVRWICPIWQPILWWWFSAKEPITVKVISMIQCFVLPFDATVIGWILPSIPDDTYSIADSRGSDRFHVSFGFFCHYLNRSKQSIGWRFGCNSVEKVVIIIAHALYFWISTSLWISANQRLAVLWVFHECQVF